MTNGKLLKIAENFEVKAQITFLNKFENYLHILKQDTLTQLNNSLRATQNLLRKPSLRQSVGLQAIIKEIPNIINNFNNLTSFNITTIIKSTRTMLGNLLFHTTRSNVSTGFDPNTAIAADGFSPPGVFLRLTNENLNKLEKLEKDNPKAQNAVPINRNPRTPLI